MYIMSVSMYNMNVYIRKTHIYVYHVYAYVKYVSTYLYTKHSYLRVNGCVFVASCMQWVRKQKGAPVSLSQSELLSHISGQCGSATHSVTG